MSAAASGSEVTIDGSGGITGGGGGTVVAIGGGDGRGVDVTAGGGCGVGVAAGCFFTHAADVTSNETNRTWATRVIGVLKVIPILKLVQTTPRSFAGRRRPARIG